MKDKKVNRDMLALKERLKENVSEQKLKEELV
jgi:hypothetical protein